MTGHHGLRGRFAKEILDQAGDPQLAHQQWANLKCFFPNSQEQNPHPLVFLMGNSCFLPPYLEQNPLLIKKLIDSVSGETCWKTPKNLNVMENEIFRFSQNNHHENLCQFKYYEMARIACRDLSGWGSEEEIGREWSAVAQAIIKAALKDLLRPPLKFGVIALGKLGGEDLNFSSDIDILYLHESDDTYEEAIHVSQKLTQILEQKTASGFLYRVDLNLRPHGSSGSLSHSLEALDHYYENIAKPWERMVFIKGLMAAGDQVVGEKFLKNIEPFVYRKTQDLQIILEIKKMKEKINQELKSTLHQHVKLGRGGIREVEFFTQAFQLAYGGQNKLLRERHTLLALEKISATGLITSQDFQRLSQAYIFLRQTENRLQLLEERQTHHLPTQEKERTMLSRQMGFENFEDFYLQFQMHTDHVHHCFESLAGV